jgi:hypothetical protein
MGVIAEAMAAYVCAQAMLEKFGGDSLREVQRNLASYLARLDERVARERTSRVDRWRGQPATDRRRIRAMMMNAARWRSVGLAWRGKEHGGSRGGDSPGVVFVDFDVELTARTGLTVPQLFAKQGEAAFPEIGIRTHRASCWRAADFRLGARRRLAHRIPGLYLLR